MNDFIDVNDINGLLADDMGMGSHKLHLLLDVNRLLMLISGLNCISSFV